MSPGDKIKVDLFEKDIFGYAELKLEGFSDDLDQSYTLVMTNFQIAMEKLQSLDFEDAERTQVAVVKIIKKFKDQYSRGF